jgi:hypothetical protein
MMIPPGRRCCFDRPAMGRGAPARRSAVPHGAEVNSRRSTTAIAALAVALLFGAGGAAAQPVAAPYSHTVGPGQIAEECFNLPAGESIGYSFEATGSVDFNIHFHRGKDVFYPVRATGLLRAADRFKAESTEEFCLMWTNGAAQAVTIRGDLTR